ncbi:hypothetical protein L3C95_18105 [Chitinophaga filiformis]|uniref:hypothetical protein n=1 Tax=Chitinophaga filiformis TaxID=104663 RepID=UPI001F19C318|nr:hypothetical protein [Chitinophaga filiformis]MCF6404818.1 hypothetical protein [Chitinophaga filiformis]
MKRLILTFMITFFTLHVIGQTFRAVVLNPNVYRTRVDITAERLIHKDLSGIYNDSVVIKVSDLKHLDYKIINDDENGYVIIRVLPKVKILTERSADDTSKMIRVVRHANEDQLKSDTNNAYNYYFAVKKDGFKPLAKTLLSFKIVGVPLVQPIKLRPGKGTEGWTLGGEFTVSYNFGIRLKLGDNPFKQNFVSIVPFGFGIGTAKYFRENGDGTLTEKSDSYAVTYYQGGILLTMQKVNFGVFTGFDAMLDKQNDWFYQGRQWFSFGLGYKFKND